jgi:hypothetical protein
VVEIGVAAQRKDKIASYHSALNRNGHYPPPAPPDRKTAAKALGDFYKKCLGHNKASEAKAIPISENRVALKIPSNHDELAG